MLELLDKYIDSGFLDALVSLVPGVGFGVIIAFIFAIIGWTFGLVIRTAKLEV